MYGPLVEHKVVIFFVSQCLMLLEIIHIPQRPQSLAVHLTSTTSQPPHSAYVGWTGLASSSSLAQYQNGMRAGDALETVEIDPQLAGSLGFMEGSTVCRN